MLIGSYRIEPALILAPMAGITDKPMRQICRRYGAGYAVSEMIASDPKLRETRKSLKRRDHSGEAGPIGVQIAGADPRWMAEAAKFNVDQGADIIDINMGCPARKVLQAWAGSALLEDEALVGRILDAVVAAVNVPVTVKIRSGWRFDRKNGVAIARIAEAAGVAALAVHGRTRDQKFKGKADYEVIADIRQAVAIPVIANGDIADTSTAASVLAKTGVDALMIGRAAQGRPWIFRQLGDDPHFWPDTEEIREIMHLHLTGLYSLYGSHQGARVARKHIGWYLAGQADAREFCQRVNRVETADDQLRLIDCYLDDRSPSAGNKLKLAA